MHTPIVSANESIQAFYDTLVQQYSLAAHLSAKGKYNNVHRSRQHSVASIAEDLFANLLSDLITPQFEGIQLHFMVDYSIWPDRTGSRMWPDIAIIAERERPILISYLDLKTDLGYKRDYFEQYALIKRRVERLRTSTLTGTQTFDGSDVLISKQVKWRTVVLSEANATGTLTHNIELAKEHTAIFRLYFLARGMHPNDKNRPAIEIDEDAFKRLLQDIHEDIVTGLQQAYSS